MQKEAELLLHIIEHDIVTLQSNVSPIDACPESVDDIIVLLIVMAERKGVAEIED